VSGQSLIEVINYAESDQEIFLEEPINVVEFKSTKHFELNIIEEERNGNSSILFDKIRTDHLNKEELGELRKIFRKYPGVFHKEGNKQSNIKLEQKMAFSFLPSLIDMRLKKDKGEKTAGETVRPKDY